MSEYTPRTERVRDVYHKWSKDNTGKDGYREFDRWLASYRKQVIVERDPEMISDLVVTADRLWERVNNE